MSDYGRTYCVYTLETRSGQRWNISLLDFGGGTKYSVKEQLSETRMPMCQRYAIIREGGMQTQGSVVCGGDLREKTVYLSKDNVLQLDVYGSANDAQARHFIIKYQGRQG